ncbi:MAG: amidase [Pigmentiphaga sp.]|uniref:amidase n=1 Tax=Pigmentiphaga sp. TaxID=1977564 RepID=UPI0029B8668D|nr:amidase [Pigmentiphaga sp.]MDX3906698.1 amidase [Pigmentiphaga sp.]
MLTPYHTAIESFRRGTDTPRDYLERTLERLEELEPRLKAFASLAIPRARIAADMATQRWKAGTPLSPIDGMPIGIKDVIETFDLPTAMGSPTYDGWRSGRDAASVFALRDAGAVILGKTKTTEYAGSYPTDTRNPHDYDRTSGGSSAGSAAAVGAGIVPAALGTQVMGSIIRPSSFCGAFGYKPTVGGINRGGSHDFQSHSCIGVIGASLQDIWATAHAIVERVGGDPGAMGLVGTRDLGAAAQPARLALFETPGWNTATAQAREGLLDQVERLRKQGVQIISRRDDPQMEALESALADIRELGSDIFGFESRWPANSAMYRDRLGLSPLIHASMERANKLGLEGYRACLEKRAQLRRQFEDIAGGVDAFITLSAPGAAPRGIQWTGDPIFNVSASVLGAPAVSLPLLQDDGMPLGLQLLGAQHTDQRLFRTALWIQGQNR